MPDTFNIFLTFFVPYIYKNETLDVTAPTSQMGKPTLKCRGVAVTSALESDNWGWFSASIYYVTMDESSLCLSCLFYKWGNNGT